MRHGAQATFGAEPVRRPIVGVADETLGPFPPRRLAADRGGVGHHVLHLRTRAVPRVHGEERDMRQRQAHLIGVVRGDTGGAELLQQDGFKVR